jgi:hypothetical protein
MSVINEIKEKYVQPGHPTAFSAPHNILKHFKGRGIKYKRKDVDATLQSLPSYTLHREFHRHSTNPTFVYARREQIQADLIDVRELSPENDGITFLLIFIDVFTKKVFVRGIERKSAKNTRDAIQSIISTMEHGKPKAILFDHGKVHKKYLQRII